ncbi:MAG: 3-phosphoshikimate 1-carboxyvinyltransferase [Acetothermia bacterium 64_32]|nr:MAG: 3-phosphoshikimate 1-carboxyvinyltransferase [Acetothermia bacterium 64_32]HAF70780.1 3-phosphoshikimate 1-carboxyvinyltransferase [Candidatus Acetothermia bacterium]
MIRRFGSAKALKGGIRVPGDKSISHRALILGALAHGKTEIEGLSPGKDVESTRRCLAALGVELGEEGRALVVEGKGPGAFLPPSRPLDCGNSGTTMRLLAGVLAGRPFRSTLMGDSSLSRRPMKRIIRPLRLMGAKISARDDDFAPLTIQGGELRGIHYEMEVKSAQVKSCVLLAGLQAQGETQVSEPSPSRDHTERLLRYLGAPISVEEKSIRIKYGELQARPIPVPGDFSSAAFFLAAAAALPGSELTLEDVGVNPTRTGLLDVLRRMGAEISLSGEREAAGEPVADIRVRGKELSAVEVGGEIIPRLIDELPVLFSIATQAEGETVIRDAAELRVKESDRIAAMAENLRRLGANVEELPDGLVIRGPTPLRGAELHGFSDHRVVMACAVAGLFASGETVIEGAEWAEISFPGFFELLSEVCVAR